MGPGTFGSYSYLFMDAALVAYSIALLALAVTVLAARMTMRAGTPAVDLEPEHVLLFGRTAVLIVVTTWLMHVAELLTRGLAVGRWPWAGGYELTSTSLLFAVTIVLAVLVKNATRPPVLCALALVVLGSGVNGALIHQNLDMPTSMLPGSYWTAVHVAATVVSAVLFSVGVVTSAYGAFAEIYARWFADRDLAGSGLVHHLPRPDVLDELACRLLAVAFLDLPPTRPGRWSQRRLPAGEPRLHSGDEQCPYSGDL
ncbi:MAG: hypothetical protein GEV10_17400 [Streptosporangiales bacterium]|nr:hypothetical protein [Streptosporangiales bacterium]